METKYRLGDCPFCSNDDPTSIFSSYDRHEQQLGNPSRYVYCKKCGARTGFYSDIKKAEKAWNKTTNFINDAIHTRQMEEVVEVINKMFELCEPVTYAEFNTLIKAKDIKNLQKFEKEHPEVGLVKQDKLEGISTLSIIATITDILIGERLAFIVNTEDNDFIQGQIVGVKWLEKEK